MLANLFMTLTALRPTASAAGALGRILLGSFMKVAVTATLFVRRGADGQGGVARDAGRVRRDARGVLVRARARHAHAPGESRDMTVIQE